MSRNDLSSLFGADLSLAEMQQVPAVVRLRLTEHEQQKLVSFSQTVGVTNSVVVQYAWHRLVAKITGDAVTVVGNVTSGRDVPVDDIASSVGLYINSLPLMGYLRLEKNEGLLQHFISPKGVLDSIKILMEDENLKKNAIENSNRMKQNFIDPTEFLLWIIENYPESSKLLKMNNNYQANFLS